MFLTLTEISGHLRNGKERVSVQVGAIMFMRPHLDGARLLLAPGVWIDVQESMADILTLIESTKGAA